MLMMKLVVLLIMSLGCSVYYFYWMSMILLMLMVLVLMNMITLNNYFCQLSYFLGMDLLSFGLILLSLWISFLMIMASYLVKKLKYSSKFFNLNVIFLLMILMFSFGSMNLFYFYLFFEISLIPVIFLIIGWGYQPERLQAGAYLLFYTLFGSFPLLVCIFILMEFNQTLFFSMINLMISKYLYIGLIFAFLVKMPMFLVHLWLPKAHVEAPISGSMILAGVMLKLGGYGLLRSLGIIFKMALFYNMIFMVISLIGSLYLSFLCLRQFDMKMLIAYSSVVHMGLMVAAMFTMNNVGCLGAYCLMISHGLCSSGLFCLANIMYERTNSRSMLLNKGMMGYMSSLTLWWFLLVSSNMASPPSLNLLGEIMLLNSLLSYSSDIIWFLMLISFFSVCYSLYLYSYTQHGKYSMYIYTYIMPTTREFLLVFLHWVPLNFLIIKGELCILWNF